MNYIKEYWEHDNKLWASIRTNTYCHTLQFILNMFDEICKDFSPDEVNTPDIKIQQYGGQRIKRMWGLEFPITIVPKGYKKIAYPESTI